MNSILMNQAIQAFLLEDIGQHDLSSDSIFSSETMGEGVFIAKETGILCGIAIPPKVYEILGGNVQFEAVKKDGDTIKKGDIIATVSAPVRTLLSGERVILNLMQRMSGIATQTHIAVKQLDDSTIRICDTRKTAPGLRAFDKYAVQSGGGFNHRNGLYDGVMLKDNHIAFSGGITEAVSTVREKLGHMVKIEVETETAPQVKEAVQAGADIIMFDNRTPEEIKQLVTLVPNHITTEISGNITLDNINHYRGCGANYISLGSLTHSVSALDISFNSKGGIKA
ncbi:TPA: carboxylating nicotinate-nucleotide diphosphorylase [Listeria innocua]|uniref:Probable nicotinate-nucleotide pyrophosphorylase [carboxylating] n=1 Tax=Listeria innocua serovar 6a (strain ATCC BAA-680 / CLIP 11262) TaxID=272626 RepID=Q929Z1_LISIN|nr:carboxylating nicotinate-nucleotide diphosphorylase [Listeria innocua]EAD5764314.1 carboxylating nicotinate-nucleotide diphosphorylase [Listeria innocua]EAE2435195.1 carboxylating nicotinate-nucleotide diphosphorylase [Listeria innocua]EAG8532714.1 carboxylating nicotinate-nucleotide diphosphorylase [Listeria innocua]ECC1681448.1 carboxylating nicotinate-nucleotide diphosphorylase [Listeria innocua]ECC1771779.1 carboxylating nicotinate-nucleotide diphosphorylase [Listeria innocua]